MDKAQKSGNPKESSDQNAQAIIEEKVVKYNGEICIKRYLKGKFLGKGGFARCFEFTNLENKRVSAAKIIAKSTLTKTRAKQKRSKRKKSQLL